MNKMEWFYLFIGISSKRAWDDLTWEYFPFRLKSGYLERGHESRLVIDNVTYDYQGEYECRASNYIKGQERTVASEPVSLQVVGEYSLSLLISLWSELRI